MTNEQAKSRPSRRFLRYAVFLTILFLVAHVLGFRQHTSVWAGVNSSGYWQQISGMSYLILYCLTICVAPILLIAEILLFLFRILQAQLGKR